MGESTKAHLKELLQSFDTAMLITHDGSQLHARPMAVAAVEGANIVWFVTGNHSPKAEEIRQDSRASATFQSEHKFVALSGPAQLSSDKKKIDELWQASWKVWFPNGKDDPNICLIRLNVTDAEFWDNAGTKGIRYAFDAAKALLTHSTPTPPEGMHGRMEQSEAAASKVESHATTKH